MTDWAAVGITSSRWFTLVWHRGALPRHPYDNTAWLGGTGEQAEDRMDRWDPQTTCDTRLQVRITNITDGVCDVCMGSSAARDVGVTSYCASADHKNFVMTSRMSHRNPQTYFLSLMLFTTHLMVQGTGRTHTHTDSIAQTFTLFSIFSIFSFLVLCLCI